MYKGFNGRSILNVCLDCEDRYPACHDHCEKYKAARKEWDERNEIIRKERQKKYDFSEYRQEAYKRMTNSRKRGK